MRQVIQRVELLARWPHATTTPKLHVLAFHTAAFARRWGSVGLSTEQSVESSHKLFNELGRTFVCVPNEQERLRAVSERFLLHGRVPETNTAPSSAGVSSAVNLSPILVPVRVHNLLIIKTFLT